MSTVRQRVWTRSASWFGGEPEGTRRHALDGPGRGVLREVTELPALALPRSGSRVCVGRPLWAALSALCAPLSDLQLFPDGNSEGCSLVASGHQNHGAVPLFRSSR